MSSRVALITGAGKQRVGWHIADALAQRGYRLAVHFRSSAVETRETLSHLRGIGIEAEAFQADVTDEIAVTRMIDAVLARFGRIDVLVNAAAVWKSRPLEQVTAADIREHFEINALGTFLCAQRAGLAMAQQPEGGVIVNIGDWAEARPYVNYAAYFPSKGAVGSITRTLAVELAWRNPRVRVNCVLPGPVMLPPELPAAERQQAIDATLVRREGSPRHIAQAVLHFIDNDFVTGVCLPVDGGRTIFSRDSVP